MVLITKGNTIYQVTPQLCVQLLIAAMIHKKHCHTTAAIIHTYITTWSETRERYFTAPMDDGRDYHDEKIDSPSLALLQATPTHTQAIKHNADSRFLPPPDGD